MSSKISGKVWELDLDPVEKLVLLALADHADHEGNNVRPGNDLLCAKTGLSERTIGKKIEKFIEQGILVPVRLKTGPGTLREFSLVTDQLPRHELFIKRDLKKLERASTVQRPKTVERASTVKRPKPITSRSGAGQPTVEPASTVGQSKTVEAASAVHDKTVEAASTEQSKLIRPLLSERSNLTTLTVEPGAATVEPGDNSHDKERARVLNRHEPSIEPSEREEASPALAAIDNLASSLCKLYKIPDTAGWRIRDKWQSLAMELHGLGATPDEVESFYASRQKKPGPEFFAGDFVGWRASQDSASVGVRSAQRQQASAKAKELLFGGGNKR
jgi:Helix-turn-helix domain